MKPSSESMLPVLLGNIVIWSHYDYNKLNDSPIIWFNWPFI